MKTRHPHTHQDYNRFFGWLHTFVYPKGRINRARWWAWYWLFFTPVLGLASATDANLESLWGVLVIYPAIVLTIKRLHDLDYSGWMLCWLFVPIANVFFAIWIFVFCGFREGQPYPNRFGKPIVLRQLKLNEIMTRFNNRE